MNIYIYNNVQNHLTFHNYSKQFVILPRHTPALREYLEIHMDSSI